MTTISIPLSDEQLVLLRARAERDGLSPEEYLCRHVDQLLSQPEEQFQNAAAHVLKKNAELYRRLA